MRAYEPPSDKDREGMGCANCMHFGAQLKHEVDPRSHKPARRIWKKKECTSARRELRRELEEL